MEKLGKEYYDDLTSLFNRRFLNKWVLEKIEESLYENKPLSVILIDIDYFKNI
ncbi:diguanylate cyclase, partial [bacterium]|nr:diguanylate cyclase [bacterium]